MANSTNPTITFGMTMKMFIVPNVPSAIKENSYWYQSTIKTMTKLCAANGMTFDPSERLVQMWWHNADCDNISDHYPRVTIDGKLYGYRMNNGIYFPESIAKMFREGKTVTLNIPVVLYAAGDQDANDQAAMMITTITAEQLSSRYRRFGTYEETLGRFMHLD